MARSIQPCGRSRRTGRLSWRAISRRRPLPCRSSRRRHRRLSPSTPASPLSSDCTNPSPPACKLQSRPTPSHSPPPCLPTKTFWISSHGPKNRCASPSKNSRLQETGLRAKESLNCPGSGHGRGLSATCSGFWIQCKFTTHNNPALTKTI